MRFSLTIDMDNAVFDDAPATELVRILDEASRRIKAGELPFREDGRLSPCLTFRDENGNTVGELHLDGARI